MPLSYEDIQKATGYDLSTYRRPNQTAEVSTQPKSNFFGNVAKSVGNFAGGAAKIAYDTTFKPFVHLGDQAVKAGSTLLASHQADASRQAIDNRRVSLTKQWQTGAINKTQYDQGLKDLLPDAGSAMLTVATLGAGALAKGALAEGVGGAKLAKAALAGNRAAKIAAPVVNATAKGAEGLVGAGRTGNAATFLAKGAAHNVLAAQPTLQAATGAVTDTAKGDYLGAAGNAAALAAPAIFKGAGMAGDALKTATLGQENFASKVVTQGGSTLWKDVQNLGAQYGTDSAKYKNAMDVLKVMERYNLDQARGNLSDAVSTYADWFKHELGTGNMTGEQLIKDFKDMQKGVATVRAQAKAGNLVKGFTSDHQPILADPKEDNLFVGRWDATSKKTAVERLSSVPANGRLQMVDDMVAAGDLPNNPTLIDAIKAEVKSNFEQGGDQEALIQALNRRIQATRGLATLDGSDLKLPKDYIPIIRKGGAEFTPAHKIPDMVTPKAANPVLNALAKGGQKTGLGIEDYRPSVYKDIHIRAQNAIDDLNKPVLGTTDVLGGRKAWTALEKLARDKKLVDIRHLNASEIADHLKVTKGDGKDIKAAITKAFTDTPLGDRSLGEKVQDFNLRTNPTARPYARIQNTLRYRTPFFKAQQIIEAKAMGQIVAPGGRRSEQEISGVKAEMEKAGIFKEIGGGAKQGIDTLGGTIHQELLLGEKNALARALAQVAENKGQDVHDVLYDPAVRQLLKSIVAYPDKGLMSSNLAKSVNVAVFPLRYNVKVAQLAGKALSTQPAAVQIGVVKGISDFNHWLGTDDGIKWKSENSEALGLISYFTPINSVASVFKMLTGQATASDIGLIGGLPFGVISRVLDGQGIINTQSPYLDPKTGEIVPKKIPDSAKAKIQQALQDVLDTFFTYPGRQAGLELSKKDIKNAVPGLKINPKEQSVQDQTKSLTPQQIRTQQVLRGSTATVSAPGSKDNPTPATGHPSPVKAQTNITFTPKSKKPKAKRPKFTAIRPSSSQLPK